jgi:hypothetical protein
MDGQVNGGSSVVCSQAFAEKMQQRVHEILCGVMEAVNQAPDGAWINASEHQVRDLFAELRCEAYQTALQMRLDAAQAAFSPGGQADRAAVAEQGR